MATFTGWQAAILKAIKAPVTATNVKWLTAWQASEGGTAANNPLNTTQPAGGATNYNSIGVKNYPTAASGAAATAATLLNGRYPSIVAALRSGNPVDYTFSNANNQGETGNPLVKELQTWGSHGFATSVGANEIGGVSASQGAGLSTDLSQTAGPVFSGFFGGLEKWITAKAGYASLYLGLVLFSIVLLIIGLLGTLGVHPSAIARTSMKDATVAA